MLKEHNHQFEVEEVSTNSDSSRHMSSPMSMPMTKNPEAAVVVVPEKRRRFTPMAALNAAFFINFSYKTRK